MAYIYPKFSKNELIGLRIGGAGLGNLMFTWARTIVAANKYNVTMIWPTWPSFKVGPWIRHEADKRFYGDVFANRTGMCAGISKYSRLLFSKKIHTRDLNSIAWQSLDKNDIVVYDDYQLAPGMFQMDFNGLREYQEVISETIISNLAVKGQKARQFDASRAVNVHVRLGDFSKNTAALSAGKNNTRINIEWYAAMVEKIREAAGWNVPVNVFSDGTDDELRLLLRLPDVKRTFFGNSIGDIIGLSKAPIMIASGSSFSLWSRFLGNCSSISYPGQIKDYVHNGDGFEIELSVEDDFNIEQKEYIKRLYA